MPSRPHCKIANSIRRLDQKLVDKAEEERQREQLEIERTEQERLAHEIF